MAFKAKSATNPNVGGMQYHIRLKRGDIPKQVLIPGDPARVTKIASLWQKPTEIEFNREYHSMKGKYKGVELGCISSGMGSPSLAIGIEELVNIGVDTMIRVGSTGSIQPEVNLGDVVITSGAVRLDGTSKDYVILEYPAVAHHQMVYALIKACIKHKVRYHVGITASTDTFFIGQGRESFGGYIPSHKQNIFDDMQKAKVLNFEMEAGCLLTLANIFGFKAGAICVVVADRVRNQFKIDDEMEKKVGLIASEALVLLNK